MKLIPIKGLLLVASFLLSACDANLVELDKDTVKTLDSYRRSQDSHERFRQGKDIPFGRMLSRKETLLSLAGSRTTPFSSVKEMQSAIKEMAGGGVSHAMPRGLAVAIDYNLPIPLASFKMISEGWEGLENDPNNIEHWESLFNNINNAIVERSQKLRDLGAPEDILNEGQEVTNFIHNALEKQATMQNTIRFSSANNKEEIEYFTATLRDGVPGGHLVYDSDGDPVTDIFKFFQKVNGMNVGNLKPGVRFDVGKNGAIDIKVSKDGTTEKYTMDLSSVNTDAANAVQKMAMASMLPDNPTYKAIYDDYYKQALQADPAVLSELVEGNSHEELAKNWADLQIQRYLGTLYQDGLGSLQNIALSRNSPWSPNK